MSARRKPIPSPVVRPAEPRKLEAARVARGRVLPTAAALAAAMLSLGVIACSAESFEGVRADPATRRTAKGVTEVRTSGSASASASVATDPDPQPLPGEPAIVIPTPKPGLSPEIEGPLGPPAVVPKVKPAPPPKKPTPIAPTKHVPKLAGDIAAVRPATHLGHAVRQG